MHMHHQFYHVAEATKTDAKSGDTATHTAKAINGIKRAMLSNLMQSTLKLNMKQVAQLW